MNEKIDFESVIYGEKRNNSKIKVIGVGGGGGNAVKHMYESGIIGVHFMICNTDQQALEENQVPSKLILGESGLGVGADPDIARELAEASKEKIIDFIGADTKMLFITAGMGKGTGTGAAPVIAEVAKEMGILTIAVVTFPFRFEGKKREEQAIMGINKLKQCVDSLIVVKNQNIIKYYKDETVDAAFGYADDVLKNAVKCIAELITVCAKQNIDFKDIETIMRRSGPAMLGLATATGENRVETVVDEAFKCPLLEQDLITNAKNFLFFITYGKENPLKMSELEDLTEKFEAYQSADSAVIWGHSVDESLGDSIKLSVIITNYNTIEEPKIIQLKKETPDTENPMEISTGERSEEAIIIDENNYHFKIDNIETQPIETTMEAKPDLLSDYSVQPVKREETPFIPAPQPFTKPHVISSFHDNKFENDDAFRKYVNTPAIYQQLQQQHNQAVEVKMEEMYASSNIMDFDDSGILYKNFPD